MDNMEFLRLRRNIQLCSTEKTYEELVASSALNSFKTFSEALVVIEKVKTTLTMNRSIYVDFAIFELSKLHMYNFHIKKNIPRKCTTSLHRNRLSHLAHTKARHETYEDELDFSDYLKQFIQKKIKKSSQIQGRDQQ